MTLKASAAACLGPGSGCERAAWFTAACAHATLHQQHLADAFDAAAWLTVMCVHRALTCFIVTVFSVDRQL